MPVDDRLPGIEIARKVARATRAARDWLTSSTYVPLTGPLSGYRMLRECAGSYREGEYEPQLSSAIIKLVRPGWTCADVGAHFGYMTLLLARSVGDSGSVLTFEAYPPNVKLIQKNVQANGLQKRVLVENRAVSDGTASTLTLYPGRWRSEAEWNIVGHDVEGNATAGELTIPSTSLDQYFKPGARIDAVKIDVEGAEALVLAGMKRVLAERRPLAIIEFHDDTGWAGRSHLLEADYLLYDLNDKSYLKDPVHAPRVYHCLGVPRERKDIVSQLGE